LVAARSQGGGNFFPMLSNRAGDLLHQAMGDSLAGCQVIKLSLHGGANVTHRPVYIAGQGKKSLLDFHRVAAGFDAERHRNKTQRQQDTHEFITLLGNLGEPLLQIAERGENVIVLFIACQHQVLRLFEQLEGELDGGILGLAQGQFGERLAFLLDFAQLLRQPHESITRSEKFRLHTVNK